MVFNSFYMYLMIKSFKMKSTIGHIYDTTIEYQHFDRDKFIEFYIKMGINRNLSFSGKKPFYQNDKDFLEFEKDFNKIYINK
jgi:hypothetical protein